MRTRAVAVLTLLSAWWFGGIATGQYLFDNRDGSFVNMEESPSHPMEIVTASGTRTLWAANIPAATSQGASAIMEFFDSDGALFAYVDAGGALWIIDDIDDPAILDEIKEALQTIGYAK